MWEWSATSLAGALKSAATRRSAPHVKPLHALLLKLGLSSSAILSTSLAHLALRCGLPGYARELFDELTPHHRDVVSWTSLITGHAHQGLHGDALALVRRMAGSGGVAPNGYTLSGALLACSGVGQAALAIGKEIHARVVKMSMCGPVDSVVENGVLDMYTRCGNVDYARRVFGVMVDKDIVAWNSMMAGCLGSGQAEEALALFGSMLSCGVGADGFSCAIVVDACGELTLLKLGTQVHSRVIGGGFESDVVVRNSLVDMYAKCGCVDSAERVFKGAPSLDSVLWTTMISAYGKFGRAQDAVSMFDRMEDLGIKRDGVSYLAVLSACSHGGLVREGWRYFKFLFDGQSSVKLQPEHYGCMSDLICRRGCLEDALEFIENMPFDSSVAAWSALLNSCRIYRDAKLGQLAASRLLELDPENHSNWVALSSMHALEGDWHETWMIRESMHKEWVKKEPGCSWVELHDGVHVFLMAAQSHPELVNVLQTLDSLKEYI